MRVELQAPIEALKGTYAGCGLVFWMRNGICLARGRVKVEDPNTEDQRKMRTYLTLASRNWYTLSDAQREAWNEYAKTYYSPASGEGVAGTGIATYLRANSIRQVLGLPLTTAAPTLPPPPPLTSIEQESGQDLNSIGLRLTHGISSVTGLQIIVRMTRAMPTVAVSPKAGDFRFVRGVNPASAVALVPTGEYVLFSPTRFLVDDGQRYGVEVRVVRTADGLQSTAVYGDFRKSI